MAHMGYVAGGTIVMSRFVSALTTADRQVVQSTDGSSSHGDPITGVSQEGSRRTPYGALDDGNAAIVGEDISVFQLGDTCKLAYGGTVAAGDLLKSDVNGRGITAGTDGDNYGARAVEAGVSGEIHTVQVLIGQRGA